MRNNFNIIFLLISFSLFFYSCVNTPKKINSQPKSLTKVSTTEISLSRECIKDVIDDHLQEISNCYENALATTLVEGRIVYEWTINKSGEVENISMLFSTISHTDLEICVESRIKTWKFPEPKNKKVTVTYPFKFSLKKLKKELKSGSSY